jgi:ABC-2 type transport system ATP-binding protein
VGVADVILDEDTEVSRRHAAFSPAGSGLTVQDLASTNGTFVNGQRLAGTVALGNGDKVEIGGTAIEVRLGAEKLVEAGPVATPAPATPGAPAPAPNTIVVESLVKQFAQHRAVDGINLHVDPGEIYGFLGPNGAGKSTTVHMLTTLLPPTSGTVRVAGFDVVREGASVRSSIGVALQEAALDPNLNSWEHMALQTALQGLPKSERKPRAAELLERVELTYAADRRVGDYSGGMKRRLDLALALVHRPRILFLDEPTTGLDPQSRNALWEEVARLVSEEGMTVFLTTQYLEEADLMANRVGIIDHGDIVAEGTPAALKAEIGRSTLEVLPENPNEFAAVGAVLERFGELSNAANKGVAVRLRPGDADLAGVIRALDGANLRIANVELRAPTLDDVFLVKTGRSLQGAAEAPEEGEEGVLDELAESGLPGVPSASGAGVAE